MFRKSLAKYYYQWLRDCYDSELYCLQNGNELGAKQYRDEFIRYGKIIAENYEAIEFFSIKDNAFLIDAALPSQFQGYL